MITTWKEHRTNLRGTMEKINSLKWLLLREIKSQITAVKVKRHSRSVVSLYSQNTECTLVCRCPCVQIQTSRDVAAQDTAVITVLGCSILVFVSTCHLSCLVFGEQGNLVYLPEREIKLAARGHLARF